MYSYAIVTNETAQIDKDQFKTLLKKCLEKSYEGSGTKAESTVVRLSCSAAATSRLYLRPTSDRLAATAACSRCSGICCPLQQGKEPKSIEKYFDDARRKAKLEKLVSASVRA